MTATPLPWKKVTLPPCSFERGCEGHLDIQGADGAEVLLAPIPAERAADVDRIVVSVNAFAALLGLAKVAAKATATGHPRGTAWAIDEAVVELYAQHPDWLDWA